jgi:hypothetical protein
MDDIDDMSLSLRNHRRQQSRGKPERTGAIELRRSSEDVRA